MPILRLIRSSFCFAVLALALLGFEVHSAVQLSIIAPFTQSIARLSAWLIRPIDPFIYANGAALLNTETGFSVVIASGCNGVEAMIILICAVVVSRADVVHKIAGSIAGGMTIYLLNLLRVLSLYYLGQWSETAFDFAHSYLWQALIMLDVLAFWLVWLRWVDSKGPRFAILGRMHVPKA